jgi:predicted N-acetyltransferase YhbS
MSEGALSLMERPRQVNSTRRRVRIAVSAAKANDHSAIHAFLKEIFPSLDRAQFKTLLEDPNYEPCDRLLLRRNGRIHAHAHVTRRVMQFGSVEIPVAGLNHLATAPHLRGEGLGMHLLQAAEKEMTRSGALVGLLRTNVPYFFRRAGWALCGRHTFRAAGPHALLSCLMDRGLWRPRNSRIQVRPYRRWEEGALVRLYRQNTAAAHGSPQRSLAYWQWLVRRHAAGAIHVALDGPDQDDFQEKTSPVVGYAVVEGEQIVELMTTPGKRKPAVALLARACGDAIEHNRHRLILHSPPASPLHEIFDAAGATCHDREIHRGEVHMAKILDPRRLLRLMQGQLFRRADEARLPRPLELGLRVEGRKYQVEITRQEARAEANRLGRSYLRLNVADFTRLVLGQLGWDRAEAEGRVVPATQLAREAGRVLFPDLPLWHPLLDEY